MSKEKNIKVVVWDLDNTVWEGVLLEDKQVSLRPKVAEVIKALDKRGVLHAIASKNNHDDAMAKLAEFGLADYFLYPQISWNNKSHSIKVIKESINIGFDAIAFIDDQPFEREEVLFEHKEVSCYDENVVENMLDMPEFMPRFITPESALRRQLYQSDIQRNVEEEKFENNHAFLESLELDFKIYHATVDDLQRVEELTVRTNQLNATGYTYSYDELEALLDNPTYDIYVAELVDKYGSYGKIGVAMVEKTETIWSLKLLLMSCRVMSRGVGGVLLSFLINAAKQNGVVLQGEFLPTDRNRLMYMTYKFAGFKEFEKLENGGVILRHDTKVEAPYPAYIGLHLPETSKVR